MRRLCFLWIMLFLFLSGCAVGVPSMQAPYPPGLTNADISAAIVSSLQQNNFPVSVVRPEIGLVTSDWRETTTAGAELAGALISGARHAQALSQRMKMEFSIDQDNRTMTILPCKQQKSGTDNWSDVSLDDRDMLLVQNVMLSTVSRIGGQVGDFQWVYRRGHDLKEQDGQEQGGAGWGVAIASGVGATIIGAFVLLENLD